jgi:NAD(P)-dependent dehydrogenase (short-subunit alcohol dehydrogenase family)
MAVALVTGAGSGIGEATVRAIAARGDTVYAAVHHRDRVGRLAEGVDIRTVELDVTDPEAALKLVARIVDEAGRIDVVVHSAGVGTTGSLEEIDLAVARHMVDVNVWGMVHVARAVLPVMRAQGHGVIVNVSAVNARLPSSPGIGIYGMTKHAVSFLSASLRDEVARFGIRVVAAEPGMVATALYEKRRPRLEAASPYAELSHQVDTMVHTMIAGGSAPPIVAAGIVAIIDDTDAAARVLIGHDAIEWFGEPAS